MMWHVALVALGGGIGAVARHLVNQLALRVIGSGFPAGTLAVNLLGSLRMGVVVGWLVARSAGGSTTQDLRLFLATGCLGGFTTFSAFSLDVIVLWERGEIAVAVAYAFVSVLAAVGALFVGLWIARGVFA